MATRGDTPSDGNAGSAPPGRFPGVARRGTFPIKPRGSRGILITGQFTDEQPGHAQPRRQWRHVLAVALATVVVATGCASTGPVQPTARQCSDTPENAALTFLRGLAQFDVKLLRAVVPEQVSLFGVFGDGDVERGRTVVRQVLDHPERRRGNEVDSSYSVLEVNDREGSGKKEIVVERRDRVFLTRENMREVEQVYRRPFLVTFDLSGNCILTVIPLGTEWVRVG